MDEQRRIADFLDEQVALLDHAIGLRQDQARHLNVRHRTALRDAAERQGADTPSNVPWFPLVGRHWTITRLKYVVTCLDSRRIPLNASERAVRSGPYPYYGASQVMDYIDGYLFA